MPKGLSLSGQDQDDTIILPYTTAQKKLKGITWLDDILCSAVSQDAVKIAGQEATAVLRDRHHLRPEEEDDFNIRNPEDIIQAQLDASKTLTILLIAIASVSLVVGGIGIMNVMLVSVTERTREIGVRVAVGATEAAIQLQFLGESIMLSLVGGAAGVLAGSLWILSGRTDAAAGRSRCLLKRLSWRPCSRSRSACSSDTTQRARRLDLIRSKRCATSERPHGAEFSGPDMNDKAQVAHR